MVFVLQVCCFVSLRSCSDSAILDKVFIVATTAGLENPSSIPFIWWRRREGIGVGKLSGSGMSNPSGSGVGNLSEMEVGILSR